MSYKQLGFLSGAFKGAQHNWLTADKEVYATLATFQRLEYRLWRGVKRFRDHRNPAYIFNPEGCKGVVNKATSQLVEHW